MADSSDVNINIQNPGLLVQTLITVLFGLIIHLFIIVNNVNDWWRGCSVTSVDHIVTSLGMSRMGVQCADTISMLMASFLQRRQHLDVIFFIFTTAYSFFIYFNIWLATLLSIVLCLKISNLSTRLFLYLRGIILPRTSHFIVASGLLSAFNCLMHFSMTPTQVTNGGTYNTTIDNQIIAYNYINTVFSFTLGSSIPLLFYFISSIILFSSLYRHTVKMKRSSNLSINLETYYSVMKFVSFTFIYQIIYFIYLFTCVLYYYYYSDDLPWVVFILEFLPNLHSCYLLYRTTRLRRQLSKVLNNVTDFFFPKKSTEGRSNNSKVG